MNMKKVLVVDDSPADLMNLSKIISDAGYFVITATSGKEAVEKAKAEKPNLIFLDVIMPGVDGYAACRELASGGDTKDIPIVFVTSKNQKADRLWAQMQGGKAYITKPYTSDHIIDQLKLFG
jgi:twitching motility two-component system response regulator PilH